MNGMQQLSQSSFSPAGIISRYRAHLPVTEKTPSISLGEGSTPLVKAEKLSERLGLDCYLKLEGLNPTGSFKDRGMAFAVAKAVEEGKRVIMCASTGNTSASAAAYAAKAGLQCIVVIPDGKIAHGKLAQALMYGAHVIAIKGNFDEALSIVRKITDNHPIALVNSTNPNRIEGQKTASFEIREQLGNAPDILAIPVGNAGNISAYWKGFREAALRAANGPGKTPAMFGFEAEGAAAIVRGEPIAQPETVATAIRIGNPASWDTAVAAARESGGEIGAVSDERILAAYQLLAREEGIFVEPASAASVAGLLQLHEQGRLQDKHSAVCVLTGNGLKDPDTALQTVQVQPTVLPHSESAVLEAVERIRKGDSQYESNV